MSSEKTTINRRQFLSLSALTLASGLMLPKTGFSSLSTAKPKILTIKNLNTLESLTVNLGATNTVNNKQLSQLSHLFRDHRSNQTKTIDVGLFDQLLRLQLMLNIQLPITLISGYRAPVSNNSMRTKKSGVAKNSYHTKGKAMDFRIEGVALNEIKDAMIALNAGGVGYYPKNNFIHIDTGPVRTW
ncbi:YcbK family protein [Thorsellia kenyensis]|uniref:Murein endopeptidase K n=1 Tax=Thorsellia kenyensis TaxID=1549888 RepID=A0ABV6CGL9_9GAMM